MTFISRGLGLIGVVLLGLLGGCAVDYAAREQARQQALKEGDQAMRAATDDLLAGALESGMSIVVTTTANLDSFGALDFSNNETLVAFDTLQESSTEWRNLDKPDFSFKVGNQEKAAKTGDPHSSHFQVLFGRSLYQVFIVYPGTYALAGSREMVPRIELINPPADPQIQRSALGSVAFEETAFTEYERKQEWQNDAYRSETVEEQVCTAVRVVNGQCASVATRTYDVTHKTQNAGWVERTYSKEVSGAWANVQLRKPFAEFSVKPGEVVLVDGFFAELPNFDYDDDQCKRTASSTVECELLDYMLVRMPTSLDDFRQTSPASEYGYPKLEQILTKVQYRQPRINAKPGDAKVSRWGQQYVLSR